MAFMKKAKIFRLARGFYGRSKHVYRLAKQGVQRALTNSYKDRKLKKRNFRSLWILKINAAARNVGINYSRFMDGLVKEDIFINRKMLAELAVTEPYSFKAIASVAKNRQNIQNEQKEQKESEFIRTARILFATHPPVSPEVIKSITRFEKPPLSPKKEDIFY